MAHRNPAANTVPRVSLSFHSMAATVAEGRRPSVSDAPVGSYGGTRHQTVTGPSCREDLEVAQWRAQHCGEVLVSGVTLLPRRFGQALVSVRLACGLTQRRLGELMGGTTQSAISAWESGEAEPLPPTVFAVEEVLGLPGGALSATLGDLPPTPARALRPPSPPPSPPIRC